LIRKRGLDKSVVFIALIAAIFIAMILTGYFYLRSDVLTESIKTGKTIKILFTFSDKNDVKFIEGFFYNPKKKKGGIFYIPANVGSRIESLDKVDSISVLYKQGSIAPLKKKIEQILNIDIPYYIDFQLGDFEKSIDLLEGIEIFISNPVNLEFENKKVLFPSGNNILDGNKVVDYMLYKENNEEERENVSRKQKMLQSFLKRLGESEITALFRKSEPLSYFYKYMNTNISKRDLGTFIEEMTQFDTEHIYPGRLEGKTFIVESKELLIPHAKGDYVKLSIKQMLDSIMSEDIFDDKVLTISIEILNGTETNGLAARTKAIYQSYGYDVLSVANAESLDYEYTVAIDRKGNLEAAKKIASIIKCQKIRSEAKTNTIENPDVTLILGKDFNGSYCKN
jgi:polyisoprenyl-teichoic acid--peptidoglycan teichoic acid transferase